MNASAQIPALVRDPRLLTLREVDQRLGRPKGSAFRAFRRLGASLEEGRHFHYVSREQGGAWIDALRREGRVYPATVHLVLITPAGYQRIRNAPPASRAPPTPRRGGRN